MSDLEKDKAMDSNKAMDSKREIDEKGWLLVKDNPILKAGVFDYAGSEIPQATDKNKIYKVYRTKESIEQSADSFKLVPILDDHTFLGDGENGEKIDKANWGGIVGQNLRMDGDTLKADIKFYTSSIVDKINNGTIELSPAYTCTFLEESGSFNGVNYDFIQEVGTGNHIALVQKGRAGTLVAVQDKSTAAQDDSTTTTKGRKMTLEEIIEALKNLSDEDKAKLSEALTVKAEDEEEKKDEIKTEDSEEETKTEDDGEDDQVDKDEVIEKIEELKESIAQDTFAKALAFIDERELMVAKVKPLVGSIPEYVKKLGADSVAKYACEKLGIKAKAHHAVALDGYLSGVQKQAQVKAEDSAIEVNANELKSKLFGA